MPITIENLEQRYPWHCATLEKKQIAIPRIKDFAMLPPPVLGDLAIGEDGLVYAFNGKDWV